MLISLELRGSCPSDNQRGHLLLYEDTTRCHKNIKTSIGITCYPCEEGGKNDQEGIHGEPSTVLKQ